MTPAEQLQKDVAAWSGYHAFVPDGTAGAFCGSRAPAYGTKCGRGEYADVHTGKPVECAPAPYFNPPTASKWSEANQERTAWSLHRVMLTAPPTRGVTHFGTSKTGESKRYYKNCQRQRCDEEIDCYRIVTGTRPVHNSEEGIVMYAEDYVYYWSDTAIVVETGTDYSVRVAQVGFCSMKCLSLWSAKIARDIES